MNKLVFTELFFTIILSVLIIFLFNPMNIWMPMPIHIAMVASLLCIFGLISLIIFKHIGEDEREQNLRLSSYQTAYVAGCGFLIAAVIVQSFQHNVDIWVVMALITMILSKFFWLFISHLRR